MKEEAPVAAGAVGRVTRAKAACAALAIQLGVYAPAPFGKAGDGFGSEL